MNVSDVVVMGVEFIGFLFLFGFLEGLDEDYIEGIVWGIGEVFDYYKIFVLSVDINEVDDLIIDGIVFGKIKRLLIRLGVKFGDFVCVMGDIGWVFVGYFVWKYGFEVFESIRKVFYEKFFEFIVWVKEGIIFSKFVNLVIDISDGLFKEFYLIFKMSGVGIEISFGKFLICGEVYEVVEVIGKSFVELVFVSGEEFEFFFIVLLEKILEFEVDFIVIG